MRVLRATDHRVMRWKNGAGSTTEIAVFPPDAGLGAFDWRVSMADVAEDGPFSRFPGIDRTLAILDGEGVALAIEGTGESAGTGEALVTRAGPPLAFAADVGVSARLLGGPVRDLNVMSRRGVFAHLLTRFATAEPVRIAPEGATTTLVISRSDGLVLAAGDTHTVLGRDDAAFLDGEATVLPDGPAEFFLVRFQPASA
ncbi:HutD family protein [Ancylobacter sp. Lp-2]|uniref:HutD/Ves family protein n=1 Tax=Ancylobacter sp. Lp-2 TaxID=2881339 RepID=UPI001E33B7AE|nr:HutD family protein [Ancylobacter sp. Lp-2]